MKRLLKILKTGSLICAFAMLTTGCSNEKVEVSKEEYTVSAGKVESINISVKDRAIKIIPTNNDEIKITYYESKKEFYDIKLNDDKSLSMELDDDKKTLDYLGMSDKSIKPIILEIPHSLQSDLAIETTNNDIKLPEMEINGEININVNKGNITLENILGQKNITLSTKNGDISGNLNATYEDFEIRSEARKGKSNLPESKAGGDKILNVSTNNGDIEILFK